MTITDVHAASDPRLAAYRDLRGRRRRPPSRAGERFVAESEIVVRRLLASGWPLDSVVGTRARLERLAVPPGVPALAVTRELLAEVLGFDLRRAVAACARRPGHLYETPPWEALAGGRDSCLVVAALGLADPANLGAIIRTARALGAAQVVVCRRGADPLERRAIRGSMGHVFGQPLSIVDEPASALAQARARAGFRVVAATAPGVDDLPAGAARDAVIPVGLERFVAPARCVLVVGNEGRGLDDDVLAVADMRVTIPLQPGVDSLGVAAAAAILVHACVSRRAPAPAPSPDR